MSRPLGWKKDPHDARDHDALKAGFLAPVVVPTSAINADIVKVVDQGQLGSCTSNSSGQAVRAAQLLEMVASGMTLAAAQAALEFWARLFPYYLARAYDHTIKDDAGTNIRTIFQAINKYGFPPESAWPYNDNTDPKQGPTPFNQMPSSGAFREAYDQRDDAANVQANVIDYARITATGQARIDAIKLASSQRHLIVFGTTVSEAFCSDMTANNGRPIDPLTAKDQVAGGHALCVGGYDNEGVAIVNSWSESFGGKGGLPPGWCKFSWEYMTWSETTDLWIVRRSPLFLQGQA